jgi:hypothetical protein
MKHLLTWILLSLLGFSCTDKEENEVSHNAEIIGEGMDCGDSYLIKFEVDVSGLPNNSFDNTFYEIGLPEEFKTPGKKVQVEFREPTPEERMFCTTQGPSYPQIVILSVE